MKWLSLPEKERSITIDNIALEDLFDVGPFSVYPEDTSQSNLGRECFKAWGYPGKHTMKGKRWVAKKAKNETNTLFPGSTQSFRPEDFEFLILLVEKVPPLKAGAQNGMPCGLRNQSPVARN